MPSPPHPSGIRHHNTTQAGLGLIRFSVLAPLVSMGLPWDIVGDDQVAKLVEQTGVGSSTELVWGFQYPIAYLVLLLWFFPTFGIRRRSGENEKFDLLCSFLPLLLLILTGSVFGVNPGPLVCLLGAFALVGGVAKFHKSGESGLSAISSILLTSQRPMEDEEVDESSEQRSSELSAEKEEKKAPDSTISSTIYSSPGFSIPGYSPASEKSDSTNEDDDFEALLSEDDNEVSPERTETVEPVGSALEDDGQADSKTEEAAVFTKQKPDSDVESPHASKDTTELGDEGEEKTETNDEVPQLQMDPPEQAEEAGSESEEKPPQD